MWLCSLWWLVKAHYLAAIGVVVHVEVLIVVDDAGLVCILRVLELCYDVDVGKQGFRAT